MSGLSAVWRLFERRLRHQPLRTLLSVLGLAAGVALVFAIQVVNGSLSSGNERLEREVAGRADYQLVSRSPRGFDQALHERVMRLPEVEAAAPLTQHSLELIGKRGDAAITLFGVDERLRALNGPLVRRAVPTRPDESQLGLYLSPAVAEQTGVGVGDPIEVGSRGRRRQTRVAGILEGPGLDVLARSRVGVAPLGLAQRLADSPGRVHRVFAAAAPGQIETARARLEAIAGNGIDVVEVGTESELLAQASSLSRRAASLFGAMSMVVGALLAFNAMLLSVMERRREIAVLRMVGGPPGTLAGGLVVEALVLGAAGTALGLLIGGVALIGVLEQTPDHLEAAFPLAGEPHVSATAVGIATAAGMGGALAAVAYPALILLRVPPSVAFRAERLPDAGRYLGRARLGLAATALLATTGGVWLTLARPSYGLVGTLLFVIGGSLLLPELVPAAVRLVGRALRGSAGALRLGVAELASLPARATATAGVSAAAAVVLVTIGGSTGNLQAGIATLSRTAFHERELWVSVAAAENVYYTRTLSRRWLDRIERIEGVRRTLPYSAVFLDWAGRRVLTFATPIRRKHSLDRDEVIDGDPERVAEALGHSGMAAVASNIVRERGLEIGDTFELPTPGGERRLRLAGTITNYGWESGAVYLNLPDYERDWGSSDITAVRAVLAPGVSPAAAKRAVESSLGQGSPLRVETGEQARERIASVTTEGLTQLRRAALIAILAAILAGTAAMLTSVAQRQRLLASLRAIGMSPGQVYAALLAETVTILSIGATIGIALALPAHALTVHWIGVTTGFPISFELEMGQVALALAVTAAIALVAGSLPARRITSTPIAPNITYE